MNPKPNFAKHTDVRSIKVTFPHKPVVFLDIVVRRFVRGGASRKGHTQLDPPPY